MRSDLEERYTVIKHKGLNGVHLSLLRDRLNQLNIPTVDCVVVEHNWPIYNAVADLVLGKSAAVLVSQAQIEALETALNSVGWAPGTSEYEALRDLLVTAEAAQMHSGASPAGDPEMEIRIPESEAPVSALMGTPEWGPPCEAYHNIQTGPENFLQIAAYGDSPESAREELNKAALLIYEHLGKFLQVKS